MVATTVSNAIEREQTTPKLDKGQIAATNISLGLEYMRKGEYEKALEKLAAARAAEPRNAMVYSATGLVRQRMGEFAEAERLFKQSVKLNRADSDVLSNYGQFLCARGQGAEAERYFLEAAQNPLYRTPEVPYANAGTCAYKNGRTDQAIVFFQKALQHQPALPSVLLQMAEISFDRGEYLPARDYLKGYLHVAAHNEKSLWLGIRIEKALNNKDAVSSYALLLRNQFAGSAEASLLEQSGIR
jgi:type IV pilus assembly protein PilF